MEFSKERWNFFQYMNKVGAIPFYCISLIAFFIIQPNQEGNIGHIVEAGIAPFFIFPTLNIMLLVNPVLILLGRSPLGDLYYECAYFGYHGEIPTAQHYIAVPFFLLMVAISKIPLPSAFKLLAYLFNSVVFMTIAPSTWSHFMVVIAMVWLYFFCELKYREEFQMQICDRGTHEESTVELVFARTIYKLISFCLVPLAVLFYLRYGNTPWDYFAHTEINLMYGETNSKLKNVFKTKVDITGIVFVVIFVYGIFLLLIR